MPDVMKPMAVDSDSPSYIAPDAIHPDTGATPTRGAAPRSHPELAQSHPDNAAARVADLSDETTVGHDSSAPGVIQKRAPAGHWSSARLSTGEDQ